MGKTALITGASSGIGRELSRIHAHKGGDLVIVARSGDKLNELKGELEKEHDIKVHVIVQDLSEENAAKNVYDEVHRQKLEINYLINNAGFGGQGKFHHRRWQEDRDMIQVNIIALAHLTRLFLPEFTKRGTGRIMNTSSTASLMPGPLQATYFATKAFVTSFSNALDEELHDTEISVTALLPGATDTGFAETAGVADTELFKSAHDPAEVAKAGYKAMMDGKLSITAGVSTLEQLMLKSVNILPKRSVLKQVREMQETQGK